MTKVIGFIGKGGTGKSTLAALFLKYVIGKNTGPVLAIDADPNNCLADLLSLNVKSTIGNIRHEILDKKNVFNQTSISKHDYCEYAINNAIIESQEFDLITMGKPDGPGCYCYINNIVKLVIEKLKKEYQLIIVDCEAGLEHLSRKTIGNLNAAFIIADLSRKGILTGARQADLMKELEIVTEKNYLIINNIPENNDITACEEIIAGMKTKHLDFIGTIKNDRNIPKFELNGTSLLNLPGDSAAYRDLRGIMDKINIE